MVSDMSNGKLAEVDDIEHYGDAVFDEVSTAFGVAESTIREQCTRDLGMTTKQFCSLVRDTVVSKNCDKIVQIILMYTPMRDNKLLVEKQLRSIF
jgi:hypothetical protein